MAPRRSVLFWVSSLGHEAKMQLTHGAVPPWGLDADGPAEPWLLSLEDAPAGPSQFGLFQSDSPGWLAAEVTREMTKPGLA